MFLATPSMHGIAAITGNMHRSLLYFVLLERITNFSSYENAAVVSHALEKCGFGSRKLKDKICGKVADQ